MPIVRAINVGQPGRTTIASAVETQIKTQVKEHKVDKNKDLEPKDQKSSVDVQDQSEEIEEQDAAELPDREAMSLINANVAAPINAAVAANVLSDNSVAYANAEQTAPIVQGNNSTLNLDDPTT
jgi:hypothetical protein